MICANFDRDNREFIAFHLMLVWSLESVNISMFPSLIHLSVQILFDIPVIAKKSSVPHRLMSFTLIWLKIGAIVSVLILFLSP